LVSFIGLAAMTQSEITIKTVQIHRWNHCRGLFEEWDSSWNFRGDDIIVPAQGQIFAD